MTHHSLVSRDSVGTKRMCLIDFLSLGMTSFRHFAAAAVIRSLPNFFVAIVVDVNVARHRLILRGKFVVTSEYFHCRRMKAPGSSLPNNYCQRIPQQETRLEQYDNSACQIRCELSYYEDPYYNYCDFDIPFLPPGNQTNDPLSEETK